MKRSQPLTYHHQIMRGFWRSDKVEQWEPALLVYLNKILDSILPMTYSDLSERDLHPPLENNTNLNT